MLNSNLESLLDNPLVADLLKICNFDVPGSEVVCGVSGGADSVTLMLLALTHGLKVEAVYVDHGLREESIKEAEFVEGLALDYGANFRYEKANIIGDSDIEQQARFERRRLLGNDFLTGHTADDQAETVLLNLLRGSGVSGLAGIKPNKKHPILALRRQQTQDFCDDLEIDYVKDPSNNDPRFLRNRVRSELIPLMSEMANRDIVPLVARTGDSNREVVDYLENVVKDINATDTRALQKQPAVLVYFTLREYLRDSKGHPPSRSELDRVIEVVNHKRIACEISGGRRISRSNGILKIEE